MLDRRSVPPLFAPLAALLLGAGVLAQPQEPSPALRPATRQGQQAPTAPPAPVGASSNPEPLVSVEFRGGTVRQFVDAIRASAGSANVNVIMPAEADGVPLPAISLREVSPYTALQAIEFAANQDGTVQFAITRLGKGEEGSATFAVRFASRTPPGSGSSMAASAKQETRVFSIRDLTEAPADLPADPSMVASAETVLNAVQAASCLDSDAKTAPPELMLHKDSMLLIVRGTADQQRTIESVLGQLGQSVAAKRSRAVEAATRERAARLEESELRVQIDMNNSQIREEEAGLERVTMEVDRAKKLADQGQISSTELQNMQTALVNAREALQQAYATRRGLEERQAIMEVRRKTMGGAGAGGGESPVAVVYDYRDLEPFAGDIFGLCKEVAALGGSAREVRMEHPSKGMLVLHATPAQHRTVVHMLNAIRRAKANEPKLPGLDADDLIRKGADSQGK